VTTEPDEEPQADSAPDGAADDLKPSTMRGTEPMYGYLVALELVVVSILNVAVTHGKGAPKHPSTGLSMVGLGASIALIGVIQLRHRFLTGFAAIIAAFTVASLPKVPNSLALYHLFAIVFPLAYALVLTQRQNKAKMAQTRARVKSRRAASEKSGAREGPAKRAPRSDLRTDAYARRRQRLERKAAKRGATQSGPSANRRYTPPKPKRPSR
jgi:hypothetical protein